MKTQRYKINSAASLTFPLNLSWADFDFSISKNLLCFFAKGVSLSVMLLLIFYLFQIEGLTKENYLIKIEQEKIEKLSEENLFSEKEYARLFALKNLEEEIKTLNLVKVSEIKYISLSGERLVLENR